MPPEPRPITPTEFVRLLDLHSGMPQCRTCLQPQRCLIGRQLLAALDAA